MLRVVEVGPGVVGGLQRAVLRAGFPPDVRIVGDSVEAVHLAAYDGDRLVGAASVHDRPFVLRPGHAAVQLNGMAVDPAEQGTGVGRAVVDAVLAVAANRGAEIVWCNARTSALGFYARAGFRAEGEEFVTAETGVPHFLMWRAVEPDRDITSS